MQGGSLLTPGNMALHLAARQADPNETCGRLHNTRLGSYSTSNPLTVVLTTPSLKAIDLSGSSAVQADGLNSDSFVFEVSGSGKLTAVGQGKELSAKVSGSGEIDVVALPVADAKVKVSGSGRIKLTATSSLNADVSGSGSVRYDGDPGDVDKDVSGSGSIKRL